MKFKALRKIDPTLIAIIDLQHYRLTSVEQRLLFKRRFKGVVTFIPPIRCAYCGCELRKKMRGVGKHLHTKDHVIPRSRGGTNHHKNLVDACLGCNSRKSNMTVEEFRAKFNFGTFYGEYIQHVQTMRKEDQQNSWDDSDDLRGYSQYRQMSSDGSTGASNSGRL